MHMIKDENGNPIPHGAEEHPHCHHHDHCDAQQHAGADGKKDETLALLTYMIQHNEHHAAEIDQMAADLEKKGMEDVARQMREGVTEFQKGNMLLNLALTLYKEHQKEV